KNQDHKQEKKENEHQAYVIVDETKKLIKMKNLTLEELIQQIYCCLSLHYFRKMKQENLTFEIFDINDNIINSDEAVKQSFMMKEPSFKILWRSIINEKHKIIKNVLVVMIGISEYTDNTKYHNLSNVKDEDIKNFKELFEQELNYEFVCNQSPQMTKKDVQSFLAKLVANYDLHDNTHKYDGLIMIICGHGENGNMLMTSDGKSLSIDEIRALFNCDKMESFKDFPKIFIIDMCRGENTPTAHTTTIARGKVEKKKEMQLLGHNDDGFLIIWSTTQGYQIGDFSLLSNCMKMDIHLSKCWMMFDKKFERETM
ncbi:caspase-8, partial [Reticulomyxa filosa]